ncbi:MAG: oligosaccharide flippase family protein [Bacteroidota bacterium]
MFQKLQSILLKHSFRTVGAYTITGAFTKAISFAALPFFINTLSEGDIGILNIFSNCIVFLTPIISMGVLYTISIDYFKLSKERYAVVFSTGMIIPAVLSVLLIPLLYIFKAPLEKSFNFQYDFFWLVPISLFLNFCFEAFIILLRNHNRVKLFTVVSFLKVLVEIGLSILFVLFIYKNWYGRALAFALSGVAVGILFFYVVTREKLLVRNMDHKVLKKEIYFGLSGMVLQTAIFFINSSDKFFVMSFFGKEQAGFYSVAATFATIQYIICISLLQYLQPLLFQKFAASERWQHVKDLYAKYALGMLATLFAVFVFTWIVYHYILKETYREYLHYFYLLSISSFVWTISNIFLQFIVFTKNKKFILQLSVTAITMALAINYLSSKYAGIVSLAWGQVFTQVVVLLMIIYFNKKLNYFA